MQEALHPTPAVCGHPKRESYAFLQRNEHFDRGFYSGPFGYISASGAEFVVGIRSALVTPPTTTSASTATQRSQHAAAPSVSAHVRRTAYLYAGVGVVKGSEEAAEWRELDLKIAQFRRLLPALPPLSALPNDNAVWAHLIVDELVRCGVSSFGVAPGSRSSPLAHAIFRHPRVERTICIDERSLGFWALGHAVATGVPAVVVTTSGTAVANLFPAVVEASMSGVPMVVLSADRPGELRASGANQTIDQVNIFGGYARHALDLPPPDAHITGAVALTSVDAALRYAMSASNPGPVHINCQLREPLAPVDADVTPQLTHALTAWEASRLPYTLHCPAPALPAQLPFPPQDTFLQALAAAQRGVIVAGQLRSAAERVAVLRIAEQLGWPIAADVLSGLRAQRGHSAPPAIVLHHMDTLLTDASLHAHMRPDCILQIGTPFVSKRVSQFLRSCASDGSGQQGTQVPWLLVSSRPQRRDEHHLLAAHLQMEAPALAAALAAAPSETSSVGPTLFAQRLQALDRAAHSALQQTLRMPQHTGGTGVSGQQQMQCDGITEPAAAVAVAAHLPAGHGLFVGNSMPIRDLDMYASLSGQCGLTSPVACNRGASGIDGVVSCAAGFAAGLRRPATLLIGDVSFLHDGNGLLTLRNQQRDVPLTIVLINNSGGGIFHFLPIKSSIEHGASFLLEP